MPKTFLVKTSKKRESKLNLEVDSAPVEEVSCASKRRKSSRGYHENNDVYELEDLHNKSGTQNETVTKTYIFIPEVETKKEDDQFYRRYEAGKKSRSDSVLNQSSSEWKKDSYQFFPASNRNIAGKNTNDFHRNEIYYREFSQGLGSSSHRIHGNMLAYDNDRKPVAMPEEYCRCEKCQDDYCRFFFNGVKRNFDMKLHKSEMHSPVHTRYLNQSRDYRHFQTALFRDWTISGCRDELALSTGKTRTEVESDIIDMRSVSALKKVDNNRNQNCHMETSISDKERGFHFPETGNDVEQYKFHKRDNCFPAVKRMTGKFATVRYRIDERSENQKMKDQAHEEERKIRLQNFSLTIGWKSPSHIDNSKFNNDTLPTFEDKKRPKKTNCELKRCSLHLAYTKKHSEEMLNKNNHKNFKKSEVTSSEKFYEDIEVNSQHESTSPQFWETDIGEDSNIEEEHQNEEETKTVQISSKLNFETEPCENFFLKKEKMDSENSSMIDLANERKDTKDKSLKRKLSTGEQPNHSLNKNTKRAISPTMNEEVEYKYTSRLWIPDKKAMQSEERNNAEMDNTTEEQDDFKSYALFVDDVDQRSDDKEKRSLIRRFKEKETGKKSRAMANWLERKRVAELNAAFELLRNIVPPYGNEDRTLSKIKTLRYASTYINHLAMIHEKQCRFGSNDMKEDLNKLFDMDPLLQRCQEHLETRCVI